MARFFRDVRADTYGISCVVGPPGIEWPISDLRHRAATAYERTIGSLRGSVVERQSLTGELSMSCARPVADG